MMHEMNYIQEIEYWNELLKVEIKYAKVTINDYGMELTRNTINNRCNNIILYSRALRDKIENG
jgi:hypothetical protein